MGTRYDERERMNNLPRAAGVVPAMVKAAAKKRRCAFKCFGQNCRSLEIGVKGRAQIKHSRTLYEQPATGLQMSRVNCSIAPLLGGGRI